MPEWRLLMQPEPVASFDEARGAWVAQGSRLYGEFRAAQDHLLDLALIGEDGPDWIGALEDAAEHVRYAKRAWEEHQEVPAIVWLRKHEQSRLVEPAS